MTSEGDKWDPATAFGFKNTDAVLVVGNPGFMPWLFNVCGDITSVKKTTDLRTLASEGEEFDKIVVAREVTFSHEMISYAGPLLARGQNESGLLVVFQADDGWMTREAVNFYYPEARSWEIDTTYGRALVTEARGTSWRFYNA
jgi:hypothetical protein